MKSIFNWIHRLSSLLLILSCASIIGCNGQKEMVNLLSDTQKDLNQCERKVGKLNTERNQFERELSEIVNQQNHSTKQAKMCIRDLKALNQENQFLRQHQTSSQGSPLILTEITYPELNKVIQSVKGKVLKAKGPLVVQFGAVKTQVEFSTKTRILTVASRFKGFTPRIELMNAWNYTKRFSRAYLDKQGEIVLESEIDLESGVTARYVQNWLRGYGLISNFFLMTLQKAEKGTLIPSSPSPQKRKTPTQKKKPPPSFKPQAI